MKRLDIKISFQCNNNCKFCVQGEKRRFAPDKDIDEIKKIIKENRKGYEEVVFTGGDPLIRKDIMELVSYAKGLFYTVQIQTNGRMLAYKDFCKKIIKAGADEFAISIHGHNSKLHDYLTSVDGSFRQSTHGIKNILSFGKMVVTNTVINKLNYRFLPQIAKFLVDIGIPQYQFAFPHILGNAYINREWIIPRKKEVSLYVKKGIKIGVKYRRIVTVEAIPYCLLKGYESHVSDRYIPDTKVFDIGLTESFNFWRKNEGKAKGPNCDQCKYFSCCEGPWREYPEIFGWHEFIPVR